MTFYRSIRQLRRGNKITLQEIAGQSGIPAAVWSWMEQHGDKPPSFETMRDHITDFLKSRGLGLQTDLEEAIQDAAKEGTEQG